MVRRLLAAIPLIRRAATLKSESGDAVIRKAAECLVVGNSILLQSILIHLSAKQLYSVQCVSTQFRKAVLGCPLIRDKMFLNRSIRSRETWQAVEGGHDGIHFRSVGYWLFLHWSDPAGPMYRVLESSDPRLHPLRISTPAVLHPIFLDGPWDPTARKEALRSVWRAWLDGSQR